MQADLKVFHQHGVFGMNVVTLLTVQNTQGVTAVQSLSPEFVLAQLDAVISDIPPQAAKTGALGSREIIAAVAQRAASFTFPLVVDPVMISKHGHSLIDDDAILVLKEQLLPCAHLVTPNRFEAEKLTGLSITDERSAFRAAKRLLKMGAKNALIKCGVFVKESISVLVTPDNNFLLSTPRLESRNVHGTGCVLSAAITAEMALDGDLTELDGACRRATNFVLRAIHQAPELGTGCGPTSMHVIVDHSRN